MTNLIRNADARRIFLAKQGLCAPPGRLLGKDGLLRLIHDIGFVQVDSIATVERAHHQILFSRNQTYRREHLADLLEKDGELFENWTHDASIIPSAFYRYWKHKFRREHGAILERWRRWHDTDPVTLDVFVVLRHLGHSHGNRQRDLTGPRVEVRPRPHANAATAIRGHPVELYA